MNLIGYLGTNVAVVGMQNCNTFALWTCELIFLEKEFFFDDESCVKKCSLRFYRQRRYQENFAKIVDDIDANRRFFSLRYI